MCSVLVVCALIPRFELVAALGERRTLLGEAVALAPEAGREQMVGEVSAPAEAFGVVRGMRVGEALTRCPELRLVPPDPEGVRDLWGTVLDRVESLGAAPESDRAGEAYFESDGLHGLHGGDLGGVLGAARRVLPTFGRTGGVVRLGTGPCRFVAYAAAQQSRPRGRRWGGAQPEHWSGEHRTGYVTVEAATAPAFLASLPVAMLRVRAELAALPDVFERLGLRTLGELAALPSRSVAERFGHPGLLALDLARGRDTPLEPRRPPEPVFERLDLPEAASGQQLDRALDLLIARLLARRERRGRSLRALAVSARFVAGGTWRQAVTLRTPSADAQRIHLALGTRLAELPAPADSLGLEVESFGPPAHEQGSLVRDPSAVRRERLGEAVRQARQSAGPEAALRILEVDPGSRLPERRTLLAPFHDEKKRRR
jgi:protein ImuB